jgi:hypothetical protein
MLFFISLGIAASNSEKGNKSAKRLIEKIESDPDKIAEYKTEDPIQSFQ